MTGADTPATCPECEGRLRTVDTERLCEQCGLVISEDTLDRGPEWRSFDESSRKRTGAPLTRSRHDRGLSTEIGYSSTIRLTGRKRRQVARMRREHRRAQFSTKADRNRMHGFMEIRYIKAELSLPETIKEQACILFESAQSEGLFRGRSLEGFAAASVYATCRIHSITRTVDEILTVACSDEAELNAAYKSLNRDLGVPTGPIEPTEYLPRYASRLDLENDVEARATEYVSRLRDNRAIGGRNPSGVAGACLYAAASALETSDPITQAEAAAVADVSPMTIRSTVDTIHDLGLDDERIGHEEST